MKDSDKTAVVICAAGSSSRMGGEKKEYRRLDDSAESLTVLGAVVLAFVSVPSVEIIVITVPENGEAAARAALPPEYLTAQTPKILFASGGQTRRASVYNALSSLAQYSPHYVLIHDGARPWISPSLIENIIDAVKKHGAVIPLLPLTDTPKECNVPLNIFRRNGGSPPPVFIKEHLKRACTGVAQTPQAFKFREILSAHEKAASFDDGEFTDDAEVWGRFYGPVAVIPGSQENRKITFPEDIGG